MKYIDYIELGFKRYDTNDSVHFNATGNQSFVLTYEVSKELSIDVVMEQDVPILHYKGYRLCELTVDQVKQILNCQYDLK
jgi:hypothetical protein